MNDLHILLLSTGYPTPYAPLDGIFYRDQAEALAALKVKTGLLAINPVSVLDILKKGPFQLGFDEFTLRNVHTVLLKYINIPKVPDYCIKHSLSEGIELFNKYVKNYGLPHLIHLHGFQAGLLAIKIKEIHNIPLVVTEHSSSFIKGTHSQWQNQVAEKVFLASDFNIAVSKTFADLLNKTFEIPFHYLPNIVDTDFFTPGTNSNESFIFLNVASLDYNKNHQLLIEAFAEAFSSDDNVKLKIVGKGDKHEELKLLINNLNRGHQVSLEGPKNRNEVRDYLREAGAFVLTSRHETFGVVLIEAMSVGIPVISTKSGGPESIVTGETGILCDHYTGSVALALRKIYNNRDAFKPELIRNTAVKNFSGTAIAKKLVDIYSRIINADIKS